MLPASGSDFSCSLQASFIPARRKINGEFSYTLDWCIDCIDTFHDILDRKILLIEHDTLLISFAGLISSALYTK